MRSSGFELVDPHEFPGRAVVPIELSMVILAALVYILDERAGNGGGVVGNGFSYVETTLCATQEFLDMGGCGMCGVWQ
jgi:hypothetical protein